MFANLLVAFRGIFQHVDSTEQFDCLFEISRGSIDIRELAASTLATAIVCLCAFGTFGIAGLVVAEDCLGAFISFCSNDPAMEFGKIKVY